MVQLQCVIQLTSRALPYRLASLKEVIIPGRDKEDQAGFLVSSASYIRQLQV